MYALTSRKGSIEPTVIEGVPVGANEVLLARDTMGRAGVDIGDTVTLRPADENGHRARSRRFTVTGLGVVPEVSGLGDASLGRGGLTFEGFESMPPKPTRSATFRWSS